MSDITTVSAGTAPRSAVLDEYRQMATGKRRADPTDFFQQLSGMGPVSGVKDFTLHWGVPIATDKPDRMCMIFIASTLDVPLTQDGAPYFDCGVQWAGPDGSIPAAKPDKVSYGIYCYGQSGGITTEGTEGAFRFAAVDSVLPWGITIGWRVSFGEIFAPTYAGKVTLQKQPSLKSWSDKVDNSGTHGGSDTLGQVSVNWSLYTTKEGDGYIFMPVLVESA